jgi:hypothetical protein
MSEIKELIDGLPDICGNDSEDYPTEVVKSPDSLPIANDIEPFKGARAAFACIRT